MKLMKRNSGFGLPSLWEDIFDNGWMDMPSLFSAEITHPAVNIMEHENDYEVEVAAPGMKKKDFNIQVEGNELIISSSKEEKNEENDTDGNFRRREFSYQSFSRSFTLPDTVDESGISARYDDGILKVSLPKKEEVKNKQSKVIEIA